MAWGDFNKVRQQSIMDDFGGVSSSRGGTVSPMSSVFDDYGEDTVSPVRSPFSNVRTQSVFGDFGASSPFAAPTLNRPQESVMDPRSPEAKVGLNPSRSYQETIDAINKIYTPDYTARDRFNELLDNPPERNDPSWARKLVAGGLGVGATMNKQDPLETMEKAMYAPYLRDATEWTAKAEPYAKAAQFENTANANERTLAGNLLTNMWREDQVRQQAAEAEAKQAGVNQKTANEMKIAQEKNQIAWAVQNGAKADLRGEYVMLTYADGRVVNSGVLSTAFSPIEQANIGAASREKVAGIQADAAAGRTQAAGNVFFVGPDGAYSVANPRTGVMPPEDSRPAMGAGALNPRETKEAEQQRWQEIYRSYPTTYGKHFTPLQNGTVALKPRPTRDYFNLSAAAKQADEQEITEYDELMKELYPSYVSPDAQQQPAVNPAVALTQVPPNAGITTGPNMGPPPASIGGIVPGVNSGNPNVPSMGGTASAPPPVAPQQADPLQQKAATLLQQQGKAVTPANIAYVIQKGYVQ